MSAFKSPNYTQAPNDLFDYLPEMSDAELRVTLVMVRQTFGYHRKAFKLSVSELAKLSGLSVNGAKDGAKAAELRGTFRRLNPETKTTAEWELLVETPSAGDPQPSAGDDSTITGLPTGTVLKKERKNIKKKGDYFDMLKDLQPGSEKQSRIAETLNRLDQAFKTSFPRNSIGETIAKFVMQREELGESLDVFVTWAYRDEFNASRVWEYAENPIKIKTRWAHAFSTGVASKFEGL